MQENKAVFAIIGKDQVTSDIPGFKYMMWDIGPGCVLSASMADLPRASDAGMMLLYLLHLAELIIIMTIIIITISSSSSSISSGGPQNDVCAMNPMSPGLFALPLHPGHTMICYWMPVI
jgi:hypothetical protein